MSEQEESLLELIDVRCEDTEFSGSITVKIMPESAWLLRGDAGADVVLRVLTLQDPPRRGEMRIAGRRMSGLDEAARASLRSRLFGFVFNAPYLLPELSVAENIAMPLFKVIDLDAAEARIRTEAALAFAGFEHDGGTAAGTLSRFDQQKVALARAVAHQPAVLVLDRADHHLHEDERRALIELARRARREFGLALIIQTEQTLAPCGDERILLVENGKIREELAIHPAPTEQSQ